MPAPTFLMSPPRPDWTLRGRANPFSLGSTAPSGAQAVRDWLAVADAIARAGGDVVVLPPPMEPSLTGLPYVAEAGQMGRDARGPVFLVANLTPPHRQPERAYVSRALSAWGVPVREIPARWEGQGDVVRVDRSRAVLTSGTGKFARTSETAFAMVAPYLTADLRVHHLRFRADPWFHGNTFLGCYRSLAFVCGDALAPDELARLRTFLDGVRVVPIESSLSVAYATNALVVNDTVLAPAGLPSSIHALWREVGLRVVELSLPALFGAGGGAAVCLTNRLDGLTLRELPEQCHYANVRDLVVRTASRESA